MEVAPDDHRRRRQPEGPLQGRDDVGLLQAPVRVEQEAPDRPLVHDPPARPLVVLGRCDETRKTQRI